MMYRILVINPGSTSTKIAIFEDEQQVYTKSLQHAAEDLKSYTTFVQQFEFRRDLIVKVLRQEGVQTDDFAVIMGRGGVLRPIPSGVYEVNDAMLQDLIHGRYGEHASNLGGMIAKDLADKTHACKAFIADPVVVDELSPVARISGSPLFPRISIFHALNQKAVAKRYAKSVGKPYENLNLIVAHLGGGISIGAHVGGQVVDVNNALGGEGPMSPERAGSLPALGLAQLCFSGKYSFDEVKKMILGQGGLMAHLGTNQFRLICDNIHEGDAEAALVVDAMAYQVAKYIAGKTAVMSGKVDAIILTGGMAYDAPFVENIRSRVAFLAPVVVYPGEDEMSALALNGLAVLRGEEILKTY